MFEICGQKVKLKKSLNLVYDRKRKIFKTAVNILTFYKESFFFVSWQFGNQRAIININKGNPFFKITTFNQ